MRFGLRWLPQEDAASAGKLVNEVRGLERAFKSGEIIESVLLKRAKAVVVTLTATVAATERFDVVMPVSSCGRFSPYFWRWFYWWEDYFQGLTVTQIVEIERLARERSAIVDDYRPTGYWVNYRHNPGFALKIS